MHMLEDICCILSTFYGALVLGAVFDVSFSTSFIGLLLSLSLWGFVEKERIIRCVKSHS